MTATGGLPGTGGMGAGGAGGAPDNDAVDAQRADLMLGSGGVAGAGGAWGTGGIVALDGATDTGGVGAFGGQGTGGLGAIDGAPLNGGAPGTGGVPGLGDATGAGGTTTADAPGDAAEVPPRDVPLEGGPELGSDVPANHGDTPLPDAPTDTRDARDARDTAPEEARPPLTLVWWDEFNAAANTGIDTNKWNYVVWPAGQVNNEQQRYTSDLANVFHDGDGHLVIRGLRKPAAANPYTSGRIDTRGKVSFGPGYRIDVRAKLPAGSGSFPGIIMMGTLGDWPSCGQLSLMEQHGQDKRAFYSTVYAGSAPGSGSADKTPYTFIDATTASQDFHVYSLDWYPDRVVFQVDGDEILRSSYAHSSPLYTVTEYIILDVALGGDMGGTIDNTAFPMDMVLDYVHVYEL